MKPDQRGVNDSLQWAIITPLLLLVILGALQVGLWSHGRTVASNAAIAAAEEAARLGASASDAQRLATDIATRSGLSDVSVRVEVTAERSRSVVSGRMPTFIDLGQTRVSEQATRPRERVTRP